MKTAVQRQGLGRGALRRRREFVEVIPPGGKRARVAVERLQQQGDDELGQDPGLGGGRVRVRQMAEPEQLLQAFEGQLDLPPESVQVQNVCGLKPFLRNDREQHS